jgi:bifunctional non-homologous end joining protein LigD
MDSLETYRKKRDFRKTSEPSGSASDNKKAAAGGVFVIHKHDATRLHYDLRLEHNGVLWSWAVTRGPSLDPSEKRLAVHVEDHPLDYGSFEGTIPKGEYGAGSVIVWDEGTWKPEMDPAAAMKKGHIGFELKGQKLNGLWHLVRLKPRPKEKRDNWLLIKSDDAFAKPGEDILEDAPQSVKSGLTIEEIGAGKTAKPVKTAKKSTKAKTALLDFILPCLATLSANPPSGDEWLHEVKFDGYRIQAHVNGGKVKLYTRKGLDWTARFGKPISEMLAKLDCDNAVLDGEIVVLADKGVASFSALQLALSEERMEGMLFYLFDLLHIDGEDLRDEPLIERKERLKALLGEDEADPLRYSEHFIQPGKTMLKHACRMGLEGVISKRAAAPYRSGRGHDWIKSKCTQRQELIIAGYLPSQKTGRGLRSLVMGYYEKGALKPAGRVGTGFSSKVADDLKKKLDAVKTSASSFTGAAAKEKGVVWVKPVLVAEIEFGSWTDQGILRHASFQGLREDKPADEVVAEKADEEPQKAAPKPAVSDSKPTKPSKKGTGSVTLSKPEKLLWPDAGVTKKDLLDHYEKVWPRMEPFVVNRPLSLLRAPDGVGGQRFFQKHASPGMHDAISKMSDPHDGEELLYITDFDGLAALVQLGVVEIHIWGVTIDELEKPDQIVFDLDPDEGVSMDAVRDAALDIRSRLDELKLPSVVKTSGGKGFHVIVPLKPKADWQTVKTFAHDFALAMQQAEPDRYTATLSKKARAGRIFLDYLRNGRGSTTVAPWSSRAKLEATVSVPINWKQLEGGMEPAAFKIGSKEIANALRATDPWVDFDKIRKALSL